MRRLPHFPGTLLLSLAVCVAAFFSFAVFAAEIRKDDEIVFYPGIAQPAKDGAWEVEIHGWVCDPEHAETEAWLFREALELKNGDRSREEERIFERRAHPFLVDNKEGRVVSIRIGKDTFALPKSRGNGHFTGKVLLSAAQVAEARDRGDDSIWRIPFRAVMPKGDRRQFRGEAVCIGDEGISVISDFDDTIKVSEAMNKKALMRNTFHRPFEPVEGMSAVYRRWAEKKGAMFHLVSASPWQLYGPIKDFLYSQDFPASTVHLKAVRWKDRSLMALFQSPGDYKRKAIPPLIERFPNRNFVLVGDSGQNDPEAYAEMARKYPKQVVKILIRDVTGEAADAPRYRETFKGLPAEKWQIFREPDEIRGAF